MAFFNAEKHKILESYDCKNHTENKKQSKLHRFFQLENCNFSRLGLPWEQSKVTLGVDLLHNFTVVFIKRAKSFLKSKSTMSASGFSQTIF